MAKVITPGTIPTPASRVRYRDYINVGSYAVPPYGIVEVSGSTALHGIEILQCRRPTGSTPAQKFFINGPSPCAVGKRGICTRDFPHRVLYNSSDGTPAVGEKWGPEADSFVAQKGVSTFTVIGTPDTSNALVTVCEAVSTGLPMISVGGIQTFSSVRANASGLGEDSSNPNYFKFNGASAAIVDFATWDAANKLLLINTTGLYLAFIECIAQWLTSSTDDPQEVTFALAKRTSVGGSPSAAGLGVNMAIGRAAGTSILGQAYCWYGLINLTQGDLLQGSVYHLDGAGTKKDVNVESPNLLLMPWNH